MLRGLYQENLARLNKAIDFCAAQAIRLYRITSNLLPFADDPVGQEILPEFSALLGLAGRRATALGLRLVFHPDQYVVLNSASPDVVANSIKFLDMHARLMDLLEQPRSPWALIEIHGGRAGHGDQLIETIRQLPEAIRLRLGLENDEYAHSAAEILEICCAADVPMVFDAHHHICHERLDSYNHPSVAKMVAAARTTWPVPEWQVVHISNGRKAFADRQHSDLITVMPDAYRQVSWIEVEAKQKEAAIEKLRTEWRSDL
jgi:UV DNA damage endonuclease